MTPDEIQELIKQRMAKLNQMKKDQQEFEALRNKKNSDLKKKIVCLFVYFIYECGWINGWMDRFY